MSMRDEQQEEARLRLKLEVRRFALGERTKDQRDKIAVLARSYDSLSGKRSAPPAGTARKTAQTLDKLVVRDKREWLKLADTWHADIDRFHSLSVMEPGLTQGLLGEEAYRRFRAHMHEQTDISTSALLFFPDEFGKWSLGHDLRELISSELKRREWRDGQDGAHDRYAVVLGQDSKLDVVWLGHYYFDAHNLTPAVALGPEVSRLAASKRRVA
jgi:hypothetical protein